MKSQSTDNLPPSPNGWAERLEYPANRSRWHDFLSRRGAWGTLVCLAALSAHLGACGEEGRCFAYYSIVVDPVIMGCPEASDRIFALDEIVTATFRLTDVRSGATVEEVSLDFDNRTGFDADPSPGSPRHVFLRLCRENGDCVEAETTVFYTSGGRSGECGTRVSEVVEDELPQGGYLGLGHRSGIGRFWLPSDPDVCAELIEGTAGRPLGW